MCKHIYIYIHIFILSSPSGYARKPFEIHNRSARPKAIFHTQHRYPSVSQRWVPGLSGSRDYRQQGVSTRRRNVRLSDICLERTTRNCGAEKKKIRHYRRVLNGYHSSCSRWTAAWSSLLRYSRRKVERNLQKKGLKNWKKIIEWRRGGREIKRSCGRKNFPTSEGY